MARDISTFVDEVHSYRPIEHAIDKREALLGVVIPDDYSRNLALGKNRAGAVPAGRQRFQYGVDRAWATRKDWSRRIRAAAARGRGDARTGSVIQRAGRCADARLVQPRSGVAATSSCPGLIAVILMIIAAILTSLTIAREWENGTMEQLLSTPVRPVGDGAG